MSVELVNQRVGIAEGGIHELQEQLQRVSAGHQMAHEALQSFQQMIHQELSALRSQIDTRSRTSGGGAEEFDVGTIREEEWPELENMVILGKGLRRRRAC